MIQKLKTLVFSTALVTIGTFSVQAMNMEEPMPGKKQIRKRPERTGLSEKYRNNISHPVQEKRPELNQFGVTPIDYENVISFYSKIHHRNEFEKLFALFNTIPVDMRSEALKDLESKINLRGSRPMFTTYQFLPNGIVTDSPTKSKDAKSLEEHVLQLPYQQKDF